jgi:hypothetical protein
MRSTVDMAHEAGAKTNLRLSGGSNPSVPATPFQGARRISHPRFRGLATTISSAPLGRSKHQTPNTIPFGSLPTAYRLKRIASTAQCAGRWRRSTILAGALRWETGGAGEDILQKFHPVAASPGELDGGKVVLVFALFSLVMRRNAHYPWCQGHVVNPHNADHLEQSP